MSGFGYLTKEGFKNVWSNRIMSIASICVLISCLILTGAASLFSLNVQKVVDSVEKTNETSVYLKDNVSSLEAVYIGKDIEKINNVTSAKFLPKDEAIKQYKEKLGEKIFENVQDKDNPLPDAYVVTMDNLSKYDQTVESIKKIDGVDRISSRRELAKKLSNISSLVYKVGFWVVLALMIISLFIIANTIRATMYSRRFEISIMKSVGATNSFVRWPFLVEGMSIGLFSALLATGGMTLLYEGVVDAMKSFIPFESIPLSSVILYVGLAFIVSGIVIGFFGSFISIRKYLKKEGNEILGW